MLEQVATSRSAAALDAIDFARDRRLPLVQRAASRLCDRLADAVVGARGCLLTFHRVAPSAEWADKPDRDFYVDLDFLDALLRGLRANGWAIVTVEEALRRAVGSESAAGRFVNFSIDDTYRDTWEHAVPLFRRHGVPVTLFVTTGIPDGGYLLCDQGLEAVIAERDRIATEVGGTWTQRATGTAAEKQAACREIAATWEAGDKAASYLRFCAANDADPEALHARLACTWEMLESFGGDPCVEIGGHTVTHPHVSRLDAEDAAREIAGCRTRLRERLDLPVRHFAFPFGRAADAGPRDFALARAAGFASASTTRKGLIRPGAPFDPHALPRCTLNGAHRSLIMLEAHLTGLSGVAARLLGRV